MQWEKWSMPSTKKRKNFLNLRYEWTSSKGNEWLIQDRVERALSADLEKQIFVSALNRKSWILKAFRGVALECEFHSGTTFLSIIVTLETSEKSKFLSSTERLRVGHGTSETVLSSHKADEGLTTRGIKIGWGTLLIQDSLFLTNSSSR